MPYCSLSDIVIVEPQSALVQLTDDAGSGSVNTTVLNAAIAEADDFIDAILRGRVTVPAVTPKIITGISVELVISNLYRRRFGNNMPETIPARRKEALSLLDKIAKGEIRISDEQSAAKKGVSVLVRGPAKKFTDDVLDSYTSVH